MNKTEKPSRLLFKSYMQIIHNSVGSNTFRNFYVHTDEKGDFDALDDGLNSCAFFVSSVLVLFGKLHGVHGTVSSTLKDLQESGWVQVKDPQPGDILLWEAQQFEDGIKQHIGFSIGNHRAISTSWSAKTPIEHDEDIEGTRKVVSIYRMENWDGSTGDK